METGTYSLTARAPRLLGAGQDWCSQTQVKRVPAEEEGQHPGLGRYVSGPGLVEELERQVGSQSCFIDNMCVDVTGGRGCGW